MHQEQNDVANESPDQYIIPDEGSDLPGMVDDNHDEKDSFFYKVHKKTPPDQMNQLIEIIKSLAIQVKNIEKLFQKTQ